MKKTLIILCFIASHLSAQTLTLPTQIDRNQLVVNSAYAGAQEATVMSLMHRSNFWGFDGDLHLQNFEIHAPLRKQNMAVGVLAHHEAIGLQSNSELFFNYAFRIRLENSTVALALKAGVQNREYNDADLEDEGDEAFMTPSFILPNGGFGVSYYNPKFFAGISIPYFFYPETIDGNVGFGFEMDQLAYVFSGGGKIELNKDIQLEPFAAYNYSKYSSNELIAVVNSRWFNTFVIGAGYRLSKQLVFNLGYAVNRQFSVSYSFDYRVGNISLGSGSHELGISYYFGYEVNVTSPRFF